MEDSELLRKKREKIESLKADGIDLYPNDARVKDTAASIITRFAHMDSEALGKNRREICRSGQIDGNSRLWKRLFRHYSGQNWEAPDLYQKGKGRRKVLFTV